MLVFVGIMTPWFFTSHLDLSLLQVTILEEAAEEAAKQEAYQGPPPTAVEDFIKWGSLRKNLEGAVPLRKVVNDHGGGNSTIFMFTPKIGEDEPILTNMFQMGWFNHQLDDHGQ